jgi:nitrogen regulatory protein PII
VTQERSQYYEDDRTGYPAFVIPVEDVVRIRTGEKGADAI